MIRKAMNANVMLMTLFFLSACGIDRGGIDGPPIVDMPTDPVASVPSGAVVGAISNLDVTGLSASVSGKSLNLSSTTVFINGVVSNLSDVSEGQFVTTYSSTSQLDPEELRVDYIAAGDEVTAVPDVGFFVFGQPVSLANPFNDDPVGVVPILPPGITPPVTPPGSVINDGTGDLVGIGPVVVSGYVSKGGNVIATSVTEYDSNEPLIVTGSPIQVDQANFSFTLGAQQFDYSETITLSTANGMVNEFERIRVVVSTDDDTDLNVLGVEAVPLLDPRLPAGSQISLTGFTTEPISNGEFEVSFIKARTDSNTNFVNLEPAELTLNRLITLDGLLLEDGGVLVNSVQFFE
ncbi:MAG: hypothetical protein AB8G18_01015 [Gammaproteobacteria bacterium]